MKSNQQSYNSWRYIKTMFLTKPWKNAELRTFDIDTKEIWRQTETYERRKNNTKFQCSEWKKNNAFQKNLRKIQVTEHMTSTVIRLSLVLWHAWSARETRENKKKRQMGRWIFRSVWNNCLVDGCSTQKIINESYQNVSTWARAEVSGWNRLKVKGQTLFVECAQAGRCLVVAHRGRVWVIPSLCFRMLV